MLINTKEKYKAGKVDRNYGWMCYCFKFGDQGESY